MKIQFYLRFQTRFGQQLRLTGSTDVLGNDAVGKAVPMTYLNDEFWHASIDIKKNELETDINYKYLLQNEDGSMIHEAGTDRTIIIPHKDTHEIIFVDTWNHAGEYENAFFTAPFSQVLLSGAGKTKITRDKNYTHIFKVKAPFLLKSEVVCLTGSGERLGEWTEKNPIIMGKEGNWWVAKIEVKETEIPIAYKYGVYNSKEKQFVKYENGDNRLLHTDGGKKKVAILHDGFIHFPNNTWKGAGVAIPVFSLRSKNSFGVGEFADIKLLVDWASITGLKMVQLLPVNDTMATFTWKDSYPYSAISAFALHPLYINLSKVAGKEYAAQISSLKVKQKQLNDLDIVDYELVMKYKFSALQELYEVMGKDCLESDDFKEFFRTNKHWLETYAAYCFLRDKFKNPDFNEWKTNVVYKKAEIDKLVSPKSSSYKSIGLYYFNQYHLHLQLKDAAEYAHKKGIVLKGDIPIGISRTSCDAWEAPELYNMNWQAGAPPDDFTAIGQNWGFPTYNWEKMKKDDFSWWRKRFEQMSGYFDAFRIDHILGFFRIWSIPVHAIQGLMGRFVPCLPIHINEFGEKGIWFDYQRYCRPFITDEVLEEMFREKGSVVRDQFLQANDFGGYDLLPNFETQTQVESYFGTDDLTEAQQLIKEGLFDLIANVIFFEEANSQGEHFHFRISMEKTLSFKYLIPHVQVKLQDLYINYFYHRQDDLWCQEATNKLPQLKEATNMLVCGEDLGMVPHCVPDVMQQLGILSLEIQRMPKDPTKEFFHPNDAPYMSVITPSTHDMSTVRGWWEENRERTQKFYKDILGQWGDAPLYCESWINRAIVLQHLYSPAMWSIFQLQDILGMSDTLRRENPNDERINNPANPKHYWQYRMHISLEDLIKQKEFNEELKGYVENSGR